MSERDWGCSGPSTGLRNKAVARGAHDPLLGAALRDNVRYARGAQPAGEAQAEAGGQAAGQGPGGVGSGEWGAIKARAHVDAPAGSAAGCAGGGKKHAMQPCRLFPKDHQRRGVRGTWKKTVSCTNPGFTSDLERVGGACGDNRGPRLGRRAHGEGSDRSRRRCGRKPGWGASLRRGSESRGCQNESRLAGKGEPNAPPRSGETGGKGCRLSGRRIRHARGRPGMGSRRRRKGHSPRPSAGEQAGRAQAQARPPTRACMRA
jgi:hypothetical protein